MMGKTLPDFSRMTLRERMNWLEKAAMEGREVIAELSQSRLDPELKRLMKGLVKGMAEKPRDESPLSKVSIKAMPKGVVRDYGKIRIKNQSSQFVANSSVHTMHGQVIKDVPESDGMPRDPAWKAGQAKFATARPNSPFKRAGRSAASVVVVRK